MITIYRFVRPYSVFAIRHLTTMIGITLLTVLQMRKNKVDAYELAAKNKPTSSSERHIIAQDNLSDLSNAAVNKAITFLK